MSNAREDVEMSRRILLPGAGTGTANNLIRSLREDYPGLVVVGAHHDRFTLRNSKANRNYLLPRAVEAAFTDALRTLAERERIDLVIPNTAADVAIVSALRDVLPCRTLLPSKAVLERCQDPDELRAFLRAHGVATVAAFDADLGRDIACQSLWKDGRLVLVKTVERLAYLDARVSHPIESLAKTVSEPWAVAVSADAVRALDPQATGAFSIDLREDRAGVPRIVDVHAGRFTSMLNLFDLTGRYNMSAAYVRLALDEPLAIVEPYDAVEGHFFVRGLDTLPAIFRADQLSEGIEALT
jgi:hypothetical protein